jgi:hypothetical protein
MGSNDFLRSSNDDQAQPNGPAQRPISDFGRPLQRPIQRPVNDFGPRQPQNTYSQPAQQSTRPLNQQQPFAQPAPRPVDAQPNPRPQPPNEPMTFQPPKKAKRGKTKKILALTGVVALIAAGSFVFMNGQHNSQSSVAKAQGKQPAIKPLENPGFTTYYPNPMPDGLKATKGSITYYKDSFTFVLEQGGEKSFFVYEQPANTDPALSTLKGKLAAPKDISLTIGKGIEGGLDNGTITAVTTDKGTILIVSCTKVVCSTAPRDILSSMQVNADLENIRNSN